MELEVDKNVMFFDDIWVYRLSEKQEYCLWAVDNIENTRTPLEEQFTISSSFDNISTIQLIMPRTCSWVIRKSISSSDLRVYQDAIHFLVKECEKANWNRGLSLNIENVLKLSSLIDLS